jgi:hypothetical protein
VPLPGSAKRSSGKQASRKESHPTQSLKARRLAATKPERRTASPCQCGVGQPLREAPLSCLLGARPRALGPGDLCVLCDLCVNTSSYGTITRPAARTHAPLVNADRSCGWLYRVNGEIAEGAEIPRVKRPGAGSEKAGYRHLNENSSRDAVIWRVSSTENPQSFTESPSRNGRGTPMITGVAR